MKSIRFLAYTTEIVFGIGIAAGSLYSEAAASTISAVSVAYSELLDGVPDSQITGEIVVAVYEQPIHVKITSCTSEGIFTYYDMDLAPEEGMGATAYTFYVCYCEVARNPDAFDETYEADFLEYTYSTSYTVTITVPDAVNEEISYTKENILIADPYMESAVIDMT